MKEMNKRDKYSDKEWEELASLLSDEKSGETDLLNRFTEEDIYETGTKWKEIRKMSSDKEIDVDKAWNKVYSKLKENDLIPDKVPVRIRFLNNPLTRIAAAAIILLSLGTVGVYLNNTGRLSKKISVVTANDQKNLRVELPDGSRITLNRNSKLSYHLNLGKHRRDVKLTGEAFFEISADATRPFTIDAGKASVTVVGTSFNVITKNIDSEVEVFVETGKVKVTDNEGSKSLTLDPGYVGTMSSANSAKIMNTNPNYMSWNTGLLVYNGQKLDIVFKDLRRVYNMEIIADDPAILENLWTSPIDNQPQDTIIRLICASFNLSYTLDGTVYHLAKK
jgi:ferric-dicitrate binding protein FerR (iron transport regulator)